MRLAGWVLVALGVLGLSVSFFLNINWHHPAPTRGVSVQPEPSATKPTAKAVAVYSVPPTAPKYIAIPSLHITQTRIIALGVLKDGTIDTPNNLYDTGWYNASSQPGQPGAMFVYGHVSSWQANGIFYNLKELKPGDSVTVTRGDNRVYYYKVVTSKVYPASDVNMKQVLSPIQAGQPGLNLMTCTGHLVNDTGQFDQRLVVFTSLAS